MLRQRSRRLLFVPLWLMSSSGRALPRTSFLTTNTNARTASATRSFSHIAAKSTLAYIAIGSNMGDRHAAIFEAFTALKSLGTIKATSHLYESKPMYVEDQATFLNCAVLLELTSAVTTPDTNPLTLLRQLQDIEQRVGRQKLFRNGPRLIDLDILCITRGSENLDVNMRASKGEDGGITPELLVPHPRIEERSFVLRPLVDINPNLEIRGRRARYWLERLPWSDRNALQRVVPLGHTFTSGEKMTRLVPCEVGKSRVLVSGILNLTPDSFSDGGRFANVSAAVDEAVRMISQGADIVDIGGESTRPGSEAVGQDEEIGRVIPVIQAIAKHCQENRLETCISIDTRSAAVARAAVAAGASLVNDVSGGRHDPEIFAACAQLGVPLCIMHSRATPKTMALPEHTAYHNLVHDVCTEVLRQTSLCDVHLPRWMQIVDPGIGFAKTYKQNLLLLQPSSLRLFASVLQNRVMLVGASRKRFLAEFTAPSPTADINAAADRDFATQAANVAAVLGGAGIVRVHNVPAARAVIDATAAIRECQP